MRIMESSGLLLFFRELGFLHCHVEDFVVLLQCFMNLRQLLN